MCIRDSLHALAHFLAGLVGKGDGQDGVGGNAFFADQPGNAAGNHAGLAGTGSGKNQQGTFRGLDGGALFGIQFGNELLQSVVRGKSPPSSVPFRAMAGSGSGLADGMRETEIDNLYKIDNLSISYYPSEYEYGFSYQRQAEFQGAD